MRSFSGFRRFFFVALLIATLAFLSTLVKADIKVDVSSKTVTNGSFLLLTVDFPDQSTSVADVLVIFEGSRLRLFPAPDLGSKVYQAVCPVPYLQDKGLTNIKIRYKEKSIAKIKRLKFRVVDGAYPSETVTVDSKHIKPSLADQRRIVRERQENRGLYHKITNQRYWDGFILPVQNIVTSEYGTRRVFNGSFKSFHQGVDIRAAEGTPIMASATGVVALARDLFYSGQTVVIDHGFGIFTTYGHMSLVSVSVGQKVNGGDVIGLSGMTGRVSGPHLHWATVINGVRVNPLLVIEWLK